MSEGLFDKRFILKKTTAISSTYPQGELVYDTRLERKLYYPEIVDLLNKQQDTIGEQKIAIDELITDYKKLEKENEQLKKDVENLQEVVAEFGATLLMNGFEIEINNENLSEVIDDD